MRQNISIKFHPARPAGKPVTNLWCTGVGEAVAKLKRSRPVEVNLSGRLGLAHIVLEPLETELDLEHVAAEAVEQLMPFASGNRAGITWEPIDA